jgi:hypothetical protein
MNEIPGFNREIRQKFFGNSSGYFAWFAVKLPRRAGKNAEPPDAGHEFHELTRIVLTQRREDAKGCQPERQ